MRRTILFCLLLITSSLYSGEWIFTKKSDLNWTEFQIHVSALDSANFIIARSTSGMLENRYIERTSDYGQTWDTIFFREDSIAENGKNQIYDLYYKSKDSIFALEGYGEFWKTTNGGDSWIHSWVGDSATANVSMEIVVENDVIYAGNRIDSAFYYTEDFGDTWEKINIKINIDHSSDDVFTPWCSAPIFINGNIYSSAKITRRSNYINMPYISDFVLYKSTDSGESWDSIVRLDETVCKSVAKDNDGNIYFLNEYYVLQDTVYKPGEDTPYLRCATYSHLLKFDTETNQIDTVWDTPRGEYPTVGGKVCLTGNKFNMMFVNNALRSEDKGETWYLEKFRDSEGIKDPKTIISFSDLVMADENHGMIGRINAYIRYESTSSISELRRKINSLAANPNPVYLGASLSVSFEVQQSGDYSYSISDLSGREFELSLASEHLTAGTQHALSFNLPDDLTAGTYFLNVKHNGEVSAMKKIVVVK